MSACLGVFQGSRGAMPPCVTSTTASLGNIVCITTKAVESDCAYLRTDTICEEGPRSNCVEQCLGLSDAVYVLPLGVLAFNLALDLA